MLTLPMFSQQSHDPHRSHFLNSKRVIFFATVSEKANFPGTRWQQLTSAWKIARRQTSVNRAFSTGWIFKWKTRSGFCKKKKKRRKKGEYIPIIIYWVGTYYFFKTIMQKINVDFIYIYTTVLPILWWRFNAENIF